MWFFAFLYGTASSYFDCPVMGTALKNFPYNKGLVSGFMKAFYGLSASILANTNDTWFGGDE